MFRVRDIELWPTRCGTEKVQSTCKRSSIHHAFHFTEYSFCMWTDPHWRMGVDEENFRGPSNMASTERLTREKQTSAVDDGTRECVLLREVVLPTSIVRAAGVTHQSCIHMSCVRCTDIHVYENLEQREAVSPSINPNPANRSSERDACP